MGKIDMTGWKMWEHDVPESILTVIKENKTYKKEHNLTNTNVYWDCLCKCGNIKTINGRDIRTGHTLSCGCLHKTVCSKKFIKDITNQRFGYLIAIKPTEKRKDESVIWECKCDCGKIIEVPIGNLTSGHTRSCGCKRNELASKNLIKNINIGSKYGKLTVLYQDKHKPYEKVKWICECDCGTIVSIEGTKLRNGHTQSCGCLNSKGEELIKKILNENQITFETQKRFKNCVSEKGFTLPFDFYINNEFLLEFDGEQHYKSSTLFGGEQEFIQRKKNDSIKNNFCIKNNIPLKRIPYWELNTITIEKIMNNTYLINGVKKMKIYLAGSCSSDNRTLMMNVAKIFREANLDIYCPWELHIPNEWDKTQEQWSKEVFDEDIKAIQNCDIFFMISYGRKSTAGCNFEQGVAWALGKQTYILQINEEPTSLMTFCGSTYFYNCSSNKIMEKVKWIIDFFQKGQEPIKYNECRTVLT